MQKRRETFLFFSVNQHSTWAALTVSRKASGSIQQELLFCFKDPHTVFFQLLTGTIWQKSVNTAATKVLKSIKDISSAKSRNFTDISRGQLRAPHHTNVGKILPPQLVEQYIPLNLVRFRILKRSFQIQNYNISVKGYILGAYIWWCSTKIIKEKKSKNLIRNVDC